VLFRYDYRLQLWVKAVRLGKRTDLGRSTSVAKTLKSGLRGVQKF